MAAAVERQRERLAPWSLSRNAHIPASALRQGPLAPDRSVRRNLDGALDRGELTARGYARVLRLAWTVADLNGVDRPTAGDIDTALYLRRRTDREDS